MNNKTENKKTIFSENESIKHFWDNRAKKYEEDKSLSATNLEEDQDLQKLKVKLEEEKIGSIVKLSNNDICLDLGCGLGAWSTIISKKVKKVIAVDYSQNMIDIAANNAKNLSINNIEYICNDASEFMYNEEFNIIFVSGLLLYLSEKQLNVLLKNLDKYSKKGTKLILREPTGIEGRHAIINKYSPALDAMYSALYRTKEELVSQFQKIGFELSLDEDMFQEGSPLNKWKETRLRVYLFKKTK